MSRTQNHVTLEQFGAVGNGQADDSAALAAALASNEPIMGSPGAVYLIGRTVDAQGRPFRFSSMTPDQPARLLLGNGVNGPMVTNIGNILGLGDLIIDLNHRGQSSRSFGMEGKVSALSVVSCIFQNSWRAFMDVIVSGPATIAWCRFSGMRERDNDGSNHATYCARITLAAAEQTLSITDNSFEGVPAANYVKTQGPSQGSTAPGGMLVVGTDMPNNRLVEFLRNRASGMGQGLETPVGALDIYARVGRVETQGNVGENCHGQLIKVANSSLRSVSDTAYANKAIGTSLISVSITQTSSHWGGKENISNVEIYQPELRRQGSPDRASAAEPCIQVDGDPRGGAVIENFLISGGVLEGGARSVYIDGGVRRTTLDRVQIQGTHRGIWWVGCDGYPREDASLNVIDTAITATGENKRLIETVKSTKGTLEILRGTMSIDPRTTTVPLKVEVASLQLRDVRFSGGSAGMKTLVSVSAGADVSAVGCQYQGPAGTPGISAPGARIGAESGNTGIRAIAAQRL